MADFRLSCCRLFQQHPLVKYRTSAVDGRHELHILLLGSGSRMDTIIQEILVNGQLLDTNLFVDIFTSNANRSATVLLSKAPELKNYALISHDGIVINGSTVNSIFANIKYHSINKDREMLRSDISAIKTAGCNYVIISTGNDAQNFVYAQMASTIFEAGSVISFVQNQKPVEELTTSADIFAFGFQKDTAYLEQLESIAFNLHYSYSKSVNDRATNKQIHATFSEPYNYVSNLEAAMHVKVKLACCGIDTSNKRTAAEAFAKLIAETPQIIDRLAALEHRRWMMEKILKGFIQLPSLDMIYSGPGITTHDSIKKWHACLVPCDENSQIALSDWKTPNKSHPELDPLDQISLKLHVKCGQIADSNREFIEESISIIRNTAERLFKGQDHILSSMHSMELAISQMWQNKRSALPIYEGNHQTLIDAASAVNNSSAFHLKQSLSALNDALAPLKEFISFKDYKDQDRLLVKQIPFALTHKKQPVLIKLLAEKNPDCLYTTCQLEPDISVFVDIVESHYDYLRFKQHVTTINRFMQQYYPAIQKEYHAILLRKLENEHAEKLLMVDFDCVKLHIADEINYPIVTKILQEITLSVRADYIDVTNGAPLLMVCSNNTYTPIIAQTSGTMINILNAPEIVYPSPKKVITVKEMFDLSGSVLVEESDSSVLSDLSSRYKKFYNISKNASNWDTFCKYIAGYYKNQKKDLVELPILKAFDKEVAKTITFNTDIATALNPIFEKLSKRGYISNVNMVSNLSNQRTISFMILGDSAGNTVLAKLHQCIINYTPTTTYKVSFIGQKPVIARTDLLIKDLELPRDKKSEYKQILDGLAANNLLIDYIVDNSRQSDPRFSFQFASKDILNVIQSSGKILEYYIYYTALLDAHFDDVEMGWHFQHTVAEDSADNELDIICTKGISSVFISAKNVTQKKISDDAAYLKYIIYEISLLADRFGINAKPALAMPEVDQFQFNDKTNEWEFSKEVKSAYSRGVYLLGKECFRGDVLGAVLDRIADGYEDWCDFLKSKP